MSIVVAEAGRGAVRGAQPYFRHAVDYVDGVAATLFAL
jgi:hypothetical protein